MKTRFFMLLILMTSLSFAATDLSDPHFAVASFLTAVHDFSTDRIWASLSPGYRQELEGNFTYMQENGDLKFLADNFRVPEILTCNSTYQMLAIALGRIPTANPVLYQQTREKFSLEAIYRVVSQAEYQQDGSNLMVTLPDSLGTLGLVLSGGQWLISDASGFYVLRYY